VPLVPSVLLSGRSTAEALCSAIRSIREMRASQVSARFKELATSIPIAAVTAGDDVPVGVRTISPHAVTASTPAHRRHWAPFVLIGL